MQKQSPNLGRKFQNVIKKLDLNDFYNSFVMIAPNFNKEELLNDVIHPIDQIRYAQKKKNNVTQWGPTSLLVNISSPEVVQTPSIKKKFKINIKYKLTPSDTIRNKTLYFGDEDDYVFTKDKQKRFRRLVNMKHINNPLHGNYWKAMLLNKHQSINEALTQFNKYLMEQAEKQLKNLPPKKDFTKSPAFLKRIPNLPNIGPLKE